MNTPKFSLSWITLPIGFAMLFVVVWKSFDHRTAPIATEPVTNSNPVTAANPVVNIGGNNNGNVAALQNSPNANVTQTITRKEPPRIFNQRLASINRLTSTNGFPVAYETVFDLKIANPDTKENFLFGKFPVSLIGQPQLKGIGGGMAAGMNGSFSFQEIEVTFLTSEKVKETDFGDFSVTPLP